MTARPNPLRCPAVHPTDDITHPNCAVQATSTPVADRRPLYFLAFPLSDFATIPTRTFTQEYLPRWPTTYRQTRGSRYRSATPITTGRCLSRHDPVGRRHDRAGHQAIVKDNKPPDTVYEGLPAARTSSTNAVSGLSTPARAESCGGPRSRPCWSGKSSISGV